MAKTPNVKIYVCHHKQSPYIKNGCIIPIQVGRALSHDALEYCIGDDTGENISHKNKSWCELTAIYWAWKNDDADYYGLMHYRRYLSLQCNDGFTVTDSLDDEVLKKNELCEEQIKLHCQSYDIITSPVWNVHPAGLPNRIMTNYDLYNLDHFKKDIDIIVGIVKESYPDFYLPLLDSLYSTTCFFANIAIMKREYFHEYCDFAFGVLFEAESRISIDEYDSYQQRIWGFVAERLVNAYVIYAQKKYSSIRIRTAGMLYLTEKNPVNFNKLLEDKLKEANSTKNNLSNFSDKIYLCMSFDDNYFPHAITAIHSIIRNSSPSQSFELNVLCDTKLSKANREILRSRFNESFQFNFIDVDSSLFKSLPLNRSYISLNTYYRLVIHKLLPDVSKVIYIDSDVICCDNIAKLWSFDINGKSIAGSLDEGGVLQSRRLSLGHKNNYINAGVLLFNLEKIRNDYEDIFSKYMEVYFTQRQDIILQDQDILNLTFSEDIQVLPLKWNVNGRMFCINDLEHKYTMQDEVKAMNDLGIIHYTDRKKPWNLLCSHPLKDLYWKYRLEVFPESIKFKQKVIRRFSGKISYRFEGDNVAFDICSGEIKIPKIIIIRSIQFLKALKIWK
ncbi:DUF4422 domain-containing protein [Erwinia sp. S59]|uniref:DUF4422 domain-containing protein n=1 Tax=Erwinia sp. S59 TaxID=2769340 RepID=UPI00190D65CB|nr:DUF4422 domain-containing protein [Erwinia sp. S59]